MDLTSFVILQINFCTRSVQILCVCVCMSVLCVYVYVCVCMCMLNCKRKS